MGFDEVKSWQGSQKIVDFLQNAVGVFNDNAKNLSGSLKPLSSLRALCNKAWQSPNKLRKQFIWVAYQDTTTMQKAFQAA